MTDCCKIMGELLQELRQDQGWTQNEVAEKLEIARSTLAKYEAGINQVPHDLVLKMADLYNVNIDYLYGHTRIRSSWRDITTVISYDGGEITLDELLQRYNHLSLHYRKVSIEVLQALSLLSAGDQ
jgi:transcriptional regulator with XRE-family HTH domain